MFIIEILIPSLTLRLYTPCSLALLATSREDFSRVGKDHRPFPPFTPSSTDMPFSLIVFEPFGPPKTEFDQPDFITSVVLLKCDDLHEA